MNTNENIWNIIVEKLAKKGLTISTMESCTGGGIANEITNISGASAVLKESYITYCNEAKIKQGVSKNVIESFTVYSPETAIEMAKAARIQSNSDISIGITGQLGRIDPDNPVDKLNCVWFAIMKDNDFIVQQIKVSDCERKKQKQIIITSVANSLLKLL